jgi:uncharacterized membrane protein
VAMGSKRDAGWRLEVARPQLSPEREKALRQLILAVYGLQAAALLVVVTVLVGVVVNYIMLPRTRGTWLEAHCRYQIGTFWGWVAWLVAGWAMMFLWIGWLVWLAGAVWYIYRVVTGWLNFQEGRAPAVRW